MATTKAEAPERVWVTKAEASWRAFQYEGLPNQVEYVRADLAPAGEKVKKESVAEMAARHGFPPLTPEQQQANLEYNLGIYPSTAPAGELVSREAAEKLVDQWDTNNGMTLLDDHREDLINRIVAALPPVARVPVEKNKD